VTLTDPDPIIRAMSSCSDRPQRTEGHGYYDFLGFKPQTPSSSPRWTQRRRTLSRVARSCGVGVALNNGVFRYATITAPGGEPRHDQQRREAERGRELLDDYQHDAEEIVFTCPMVCPYYLSDAKGVQVDSVPTPSADTAAPTTTGGSTRLSCVACPRSGTQR